MTKIFIQGVVDATELEPPHIWGGGNVPMPSPPIHIPGQPPGTWGGGNVPMPNPPIHIPPLPSPLPPGIWGGGNVPMPNPPIYIDPNPIQPPSGVEQKVEWHAAWTQESGWVMIGIPQFSMPTPSKK